MLEASNISKVKQKSEISKKGMGQNGQYFRNAAPAPLLTFMVVRISKSQNKTEFRFTLTNTHIVHVLYKIYDNIPQKPSILYLEQIEEEKKSRKKDCNLTDIVYKRKHTHTALGTNLSIWWSHSKVKILEDTFSNEKVKFRRTTPICSVVSFQVLVLWLLLMQIMLNEK